MRGATPAGAGLLTVLGTVVLFACGPKQAPGAGAVPPEAYVGVALSQQQACGLRGDRTLWCWETVESPGTTANEPVQVGVGRWRQVVEGAGRVCALDEDGGAWCWQGPPTRSGAEPAPVAPGRRWSQISVDGARMCGILDSGEASCWGEAFGEGPFRLDLAGTWRQVTAETGGACGIRTDGSAWCWGYRGAERKVDPGPWQQLDMRGTRVCGVREDGGLWCWWFDDARGALPLVQAEGTWREVAVGPEEACAIRDDRSLWCWPVAEVLGTDLQVVMREGRWTLEQGAPSDWRWSDLGVWQSPTVSISHLCALQDDGGLWCWKLGYDPQGRRTVQGPRELR